MKIKDYTDILKYAQKASVMLEKTSREEFKRLILDILQNVYGNTAKLLLKLLKKKNINLYCEDLQIYNRGK